MLTQQWFWLRWGILGLCWGLFCLVWLIGAIYNALKAPAVRKRSGLFSTWIKGRVKHSGMEEQYRDSPSASHNGGGMGSHLTVSL